MHFSTLTLTALFALTSALPSTQLSRREVHLDSGLRIRNVGYQGDGIYTAAFDDAGVATIEFTPLADLNITVPVVSRDIPGWALTPRAQYPVCKPSKTNNLAALDAANILEARKIQDQKYHPKGLWGYSFVEGELSWICNFADNVLDYQTPIDMQTAISRKCGQSTYGYDRRTNCCGANDLEAGRSFKGDTFCAPGFTGL